ncbi:HAD family hydrolase [Isoptericola sp. b490]|uniref:HAD family hydrolase n=1 Tax=Actinotalea lenta TaxID=3064654 RepID=UPI002713B24C|nr:HAD family hydrolase [Isoptericola sp. b490]MDO8122308.1 HAD family hydrolase [Isoptericola sp. b490]
MTADGAWLVALDLDGTVLDYQERLSAAVVDAVSATRAAGHHVVLATGRSVTATLPVARALGISQGWAVCSNGSLTIRMDPALELGYEVVEMVTFDPGPAIRLLHAHLPDALFAVEEIGVGFRMNKPFPPGELHGDHTIVGIEDLAAEHVTRLVVRSPEHTPDEFHALVAQVGLHDVTYAIGWTAWMDVAPEGVTKASALELLRDRLGVGGRTVAVGDGSNDVDMLRWATRGIAMGHAAPDVRAAADEVTGAVDADGVVAALESLPGRS